MTAQVWSERTPWHVRARARAAPGQLIALAFDSPLYAQEAMLAMLRLQEHGKLELHEAVFVTRPEHGAPRVSDTTDPTAVAVAVPAALVGGVVGAIAFGPLGFLGVGALAGSVAAGIAKLVDRGIPRKAIRRLGRAVRPGQTLLIVRVGEFAGPAVLAELRRFDGVDLVYAQLSAPEIQRIEDALHSH